MYDHKESLALKLEPSVSGWMHHHNNNMANQPTKPPTNQATIHPTKKKCNQTWPREAKMISEWSSNEKRNCFWIVSWKRRIVLIFSRYGRERHTVAFIQVVVLHVAAVPRPDVWLEQMPLGIRLSTRPAVVGSFSWKTKESHQDLAQMRVV